MNRKIICDFINQHFVSIKSFNTLITSYGLKYMVEKELRDYISNDDLIACMVQCGFNTKRVEFLKKTAVNYYFNVSKKSINNLKRGKQWLN